MTKKITLITLENNNMGDSIIADTCEYLVKNISNDIAIERLNLFPEKKLYKGLNVKYTYRYPRWKQKMKFFKYKLYSRKGSPIYKFYENGLKNSDAVIFAGGGLIKHSREAFWNPIYTIVNYCSEYGIPVYFNAVGIEGFDSNNVFSNVLKETLNNSAIKFITTRDDLRSLEYYVENKSKISIVGDPALWTKETYSNITDKINVSDNDIIGVGVIRGRIFKDYGIKYYTEQIKNSYVNLVKQLDVKGYKWQLFCNGNDDDYEMCLDILRTLNISPNKNIIATRPISPEDLINIIGNYKGIIAARLHASIVATSLGIPAVGYVWNEKLKLFGKQLGIEDRFIDNKNFENPVYVVEKLETAIKEGFDSDKINYLKNLTVDKLKSFISTEVLSK